MHDELDRTDTAPRTSLVASEERPLRLARGTQHEIEQPALAPRPLTTIPWFETVPAALINPADLLDEPSEVVPVPVAPLNELLAASAPPQSKAPPAQPRVSTRTMPAPPLPNRGSRASVPPPFRAPTASYQEMPPAPAMFAQASDPSIHPPMFTTTALQPMPGMFPVVAQPGPFPPPYAPYAPQFPSSAHSIGMAPVNSFTPNAAFAPTSFDTGSVPVKRTSGRASIALLFGAVAVTAVLAVAITLSVSGQNEPTRGPTLASSPATPTAAAPAKAALAAPPPTTSPASATAPAPTTAPVAPAAPATTDVQPAVAAAAVPAVQPTVAAAREADVAPVATTVRPHHHHHHDAATKSNATMAMATPTHSNAPTTSPSKSPASKSGKRARGALADPFATTTTTTTASHTTTKPTAAPKTVAMAAPPGGGTLMVSTKPPCTLIIDGKATHLETPQRALHLSPGVHDITFINAAEKIRKNVSVTISASKTTKLVRDFTH